MTFLLCTRVFLSEVKLLTFSFDYVCQWIYNVVRAGDSASFVPLRLPSRRRHIGPAIQLSRQPPGGLQLQRRNSLLLRRNRIAESRATLLQWPKAKECSRAEDRMESTSLWVFCFCLYFERGWFVHLQQSCHHWGHMPQDGLHTTGSGFLSHWEWGIAGGWIVRWQYTHTRRTSGECGKRRGALGSSQQLSLVASHFGFREEQVDRHQLPPYPQTHRSRRPTPACLWVIRCYGQTMEMVGWQTNRAISSKGPSASSAGSTVANDLPLRLRPLHHHLLIGWHSKYLEATR